MTGREEPPLSLFNYESDTLWEAARLELRLYPLHSRLDTRLGIKISEPGRPDVF
jgi:hypothetical protein